MNDADRERIIKGIAVYGHEQKVLLRLLRKRGSFTDQEFDRWFCSFKRGRKRAGRYIPYSGDTFILGYSGGTKSRWGLMLELLQMMSSIGLVRVKDQGERTIYSEAIADE